MDKKQTRFWKKRESSSYFNSLFKHSKIFQAFPLEDTLIWKLF